MGGVIGRPDFGDSVGIVRCEVNERQVDDGR